TPTARPSVSEPGPARRWRAPAAALGTLLAVVLLLFHDIVFSGRVLYERDVHAYFVPFADVLRRMVGEGTWPLWNPYQAFGQPLLANPQFEVLYPVTWLLAPLPAWTAYSVFVLVHSFFSAAGV